MVPFIDRHLCVLVLFSSSVLLPVFSSFSTFCKLRRKFHLNTMRKSGDVILGGLFEVHYSSIFPELSFTSEPHQPKCQG